jgi:DNA-binding XRE family transcriptional regulator
MNRQVYIYGLIDPRTRTLRYVGASIDPAKRLKEHLGFARRLPSVLPSKRLGPWLAELIALDIEPEMVILETTDEADAQAAEDRWIAAYEAKGDLCNRAGATTHRRMGVERPERPSPESCYRAPRKPASTRSTPKETIIEFRERRGWSQAQLALMLGVHYSTVSLWESGKRRIPASIEMALKSIP